MADQSNPALSALNELEIMPGRVERPENDEQLKQILSDAWSEGESVMPLGGGTALGVAALPDNVDIALDMTGLSDIVNFDGSNLNITVRAGMTLDAINEFLEKKGRGFFLPLDPPFSHRATLGGAYASNASGPFRQLYGTLRDQALGIGAVGADGTPLHFGGVTVKNVSGYDLTKFFIGSAGSLCVIQDVSLRVHPFPDASGVCEFEFDDHEKIRKLLSDLRASVLAPSGILVTNGSGASYRVVGAFEGHRDAVGRQIKDFSSMSEKLGGKGSGETGREAMLSKLRSSLNPEDESKAGLILKAGVPIIKGPDAMHACAAIGKDVGADMKTVLLGGNGVLYLYASGSDDAVSDKLIQQVKERIKALDGHVQPLKASRSILSSWGSRVDSIVGSHVLGPIKQKLDPKGVLLPLT